MLEPSATHNRQPNDSREQPPALNLKHVPTSLSKRTILLANALFDEPALSRIKKVLEEEVGEDLPFCDDSSPEQMERLRFAALNLIHRDVADWDWVIELAKSDWRDLLMAADFGHVLEHDKYFNQIVCATED